MDEWSSTTLAIQALARYTVRVPNNNEPERLTSDTTTKIDRVARYLLDAAPRVMRLVSQETLSGDPETALTWSQVRALRLVINGHRLPSEIARHMRITPASVSELIDGLARRGLVARSEQPGDRRCTILTVTDLGHRHYEASLERALVGLRRLMEQLDPEDLAALDRGLASLIDLLPGPTSHHRSADGSQ
ncbi:MAG TPA: MarR family transcriptional regulator [Tepidisphaeraceae bacterium]|nr:MarR family transcriptional regulator [Tepidisphaeraceae bacterium]